MNEKICYKKLDEDDILEILIEHFQDDELSDYISAQGCLLGEPGRDLRFVGVFSNNDETILKHDLEILDKEIEYNGDHAFFKKHPEFNFNPSSQDD